MNDDYVEDDFDDVDDHDQGVEDLDDDEGAGSEGGGEGFVEEDNEVYEEIDAAELAEMHPLMRIFRLRSMRGIQVTHHLPNHPGDVLYSDSQDPVLVLVGFRNEGNTPVNVTSIAGSLNNAAEYHYHMHNYTHTHYGQMVQPQEEYTFSYTFHLHDLLDPVMYRSPLTVFYETEEYSFRTTFFNGTIEVKEPPSRVDVPMMMTWCILLSLIGGIALYAYDFSQKRIHGKKYRAIIPAIVDTVLGALGDAGNAAISKADSALTGGGAAEKEAARKKEMKKKIATKKRS